MYLYFNTNFDTFKCQSFALMRPLNFKIIHLFIFYLLTLIYHNLDS